jgi:hypothetical protein
MRERTGQKKVDIDLISSFLIVLELVGLIPESYKALARS